VLWGDEAKKKRGIVMKKFWILPFLILLIIVISVIVMDGKRTIHSKEDCEDESIPSVEEWITSNKFL
jgi:cytosine/uracil/thiamine/allantoin permease